jgi:hypothetical protein
MCMHNSSAQTYACILYNSRISDRYSVDDDDDDDTVEFTVSSRSEMMILYCVRLHDRS